MRENQTYDKALSYAVRIVNLYKYLVDEKKEYVMSKQLLRSGTSIGANETSYWLALLEKTGYLSGIQHGSMSSDCTEIRKYWFPAY